MGLVHDAERFEHGIVVAPRACDCVGSVVGLHSSILINFDVFGVIMQYTIGARWNARVVELFSVVHFYFICIRGSFTEVVFYHLMILQVLLKLVWGVLGASKVQVTEQGPVTVCVIFTKMRFNLLEIFLS